MTSRPNKQSLRPLNKESWLTMDILDQLDILEKDVYRDREYTLANDMLKAIRNDPC